MEIHHNFILQDNKIQKNEKRTLLVVILTFVTMIVEIFFGYLTGSMALLADGWHMGSHVGALGISFIVYKMARSKSLSKKLSFGTGKLIPLGGYTSAILLGLVSFFMIVESFGRMLNVESINYDTAIVVAIVGLVVNVLSAFILWDSHVEHDHGHTHDHNHQGAFMHVIADAFTSILAIFALLLGKHLEWSWADPVMGVIGGLVILKWSFGLIKNTLVELLDAQVSTISNEELIKLYKDFPDTKVIDFHHWRIAPNAYAVEIVIETTILRGSEIYRSLFLKKHSVEHLVIEERLIAKS